jgi:hypothetical protein
MNTCDQCDFLFINGVGCHESGCPKDRRIRQMRTFLVRNSSYDTHLVMELSYEQLEVAMREEGAE